MLEILREARVEDADTHQRAKTERVPEYESKLNGNIEKLEKLHMGDAQRAEIILVMGGLKPATELLLYKWNSPVDETKKVLEEIGLFVEQYIDADMGNSDYVGTLRIAKDKGVLGMLSKNNRQTNFKEYCLLTGIPPTVAEAYENERFLSEQDYPANQRVLFRLFSFKLSQDHWREEVQTVNQWNNFIQQYAPELWQRILK